MAVHRGDTCPSALDLLEHSAGSIEAGSRDAIVAHLAHCDACSEVLRSLQASGLLSDDHAREQQPATPVPEEIHSASMTGVERFRREIVAPQPLRARFGQIWSTAPASDPVHSDMTRWSAPRLVVVLEEVSEDAVPGETSLIVAPVSLELAYQSDRDLLVPIEESPLGYPFMIEVWNEITLLRAQLSRYAGTLWQPFKRYLGLLHQVQLGADVDLSPLAAYLGPPISSEEDPRVVFEETEHEACEYLRGPLLQRALGAEEMSKREATRTVLTLLREHVPSGYPEEGDDQALTVGDVAARLQADAAALRTVLVNEREANRRLLGDDTPVPLPVTEAAVAQLAAQLSITAGPRYWEAFRRAAIVLAMTRQRGQAELVAARRQSRRPRRPRVAGLPRPKEEQG